jgi:hypothetical protein
MGLLIGLTGKAGSGKDTVANYLKATYPDTFKSIAFADPIREAMRAIFGWNDSHFAHPRKNEVDPVYGISPRRAMQTLGTEWGRELINQDIWLMIANEKIKILHSQGFSAIITDVRFENEANFITVSDGIVWHIERDIQGAGAEGGHASEAGVEFNAACGDIRIVNNGTLEDLYKQVDEALVLSR